MESIKQLIDAELAKVADHSRREHLRTLLVTPEPLSLRWAYGQKDDGFACWLVALSPDGQKRLLYCEQGFGPTCPWGFVGSEQDWMGMDCQWHAALEHAAIGAGLLDAPPDYEVP